MDNADKNTPGGAVPPLQPRGRSRRKTALTTLAAIVVVAGGGWALYDWLVLSHYESTDNAYVQGNVVQITPQIAGTVISSAPTSDLRVSVDVRLDDGQGLPLKQEVPAAA